jgi:hypothetical protein
MKTHALDPPQPSFHQEDGAPGSPIDTSESTSSPLAANCFAACASRPLRGLHEAPIETPELTERDVGHMVDDVQQRHMRSVLARKLPRSWP